MNKFERPCWALKDIREIEKSLVRQKIPRKRVDIVPQCIVCNVAHGKSERMIIRNDGRFICASKFLIMLRENNPAATLQNVNAHLISCNYHQLVYPLAFYSGSDYNYPNHEEKNASGAS